MAQPLDIPLRDAVMHLYKPNAPATARIVKNELCTTGKKAAGFVRHVEIDLTGTDLVGRFIPGQSIGVVPPGVDEKGRTHKLRLYSVASPTTGEDGKGVVVSTTVKRLIDEHWDNHKLFLGVASNFLCDCQPGDTIQVTGPAGKKFVLPANANEHDYLYFATGTGIAPFRGMLLDLLREKSNSKIALVMGAAYSTDLLYDPFFRETAAKHANFRYFPTISRETNDGGKHGRLYVQDRLRTERDELAAMLSTGKTLIYICGIAGMELGIFQQLATILPPAALAHYIDADADAMANIKAWERSMLHKQIRLSRRIFMEVYA